MSPRRNGHSVVIVAYIEIASPPRIETPPPLTSPAFGSGSSLFSLVLIPVTTGLSFTATRDGKYLPGVPREYVADRHPHPRTRYPFSTISPDKHRGRCPESRTAGARRLASRRPAAPVFLPVPTSAIWSSRSLTTYLLCARVAPAGKRARNASVYERIPASRRLGRREERCKDEIRGTRNKYRVFDK